MHRLLSRDWRYVVALSLSLASSWLPCSIHEYTEDRYEREESGTSFSQAAEVTEMISPNPAPNGAAALGWAFSTSAELGERSGEATESVELIRL